MRKFLNHSRGAFLFLLLFVSFSSKAQNEAMDSINLQLRQFFGSLQRPTPSKDFLYDMSAHVTDSVYYQSNCSRVNETEVWYKVYEEMFHSAYDTTTLIPVDTVFYHAGAYEDTIPIGYNQLQLLPFEAGCFNHK